MSAIIAYEAPHFSVIFTDGATYDENIRITELGRKVTVSEKVPLAIATRGNKFVGGFLKEEILSAVEGVGFDQGMCFIEDMMPAWLRFIEENGPEYRTQVLIAGISEKHGPRNTFFQVPGSNASPAGKLIHQPGFFTGLNCEEGLTLNAMGVRDVRPGESFVDWIRDAGISMMEHARNNPGPSPYFEGLYHSTGGQVDMTVVTAKGATVQTIHMWNDKVGEFIDPSKDRPTGRVVPIATIMPGMNRQQRRAATREARRRRAA